MSFHSSPALEASAVHVWTLHIPTLERQLGEPQNLLSADEIERWQRYRFEEDRRRFATTRQALRLLLGKYTGANPKNLAFSYGTQGKPRLAQPTRDLSFNVSHSRDFAVLAFTRGRQLGVDIEFHKPDVEVSDLAHRFFSLSEQQALQKTPDSERSSFFYQIWTAKESLIKAMGTGLSLPLDSFDVSLDSGVRLLATRPNFTEAAKWRLLILAAPEGYSACLATEGIMEPPLMLSW